MENDYYTSLTDDNSQKKDFKNNEDQYVEDQYFENKSIENFNPESGAYYDVKEKPTRTEFNRQPEQREMKRAMIIYSVIIIIVSVIDYFLLWKSYDGFDDVPDSVFYTIQTLIFAVALVQVPILIWANELTTIIGIILTISTLYISLINLSFTSIGLVSMFIAALQFNKAQAITGKYKRKYSDV